MREPRLDYTNNFNHPHMARGSHMLGDTPVVISPNVPQFHSADELVWVRPWRVVAFFWRLFGANPDRLIRFKRGLPIMEEQAFQMQGKLFLSPKMWDALCAHTSLTNGQ